jgi:osmotically-inducible protein OsmY
VTPAPVVKVQQYPKVRAATIADEPIAQFVREHLQREAVPPEWLQNVTITVSDGNAHVQGLVDSQEQHLVIIGATQRAPGIGTVYDELRSRSGPSGNSKS